MITHPSPGIYTISTKFWRAPSVDRAFDGWFEEAPTAEQRQEAERAVLEKRAN